MSTSSNEVGKGAEISDAIMRSYYLPFECVCMPSSLKARCLSTIAQHLHVYIDVLENLMHYFDEETIFRFSCYCSYHNTITDEIMEVFAKIPCKMLTLGKNISTIGLRKLVPELIRRECTSPSQSQNQRKNERIELSATASEVSVSSDDVYMKCDKDANLGKKSAQNFDILEIGEEEDSWENFSISSRGSYTLRSITFVQSRLSAVDVELVTTSLRLLEELKFINVKMKGNRVEMINVIIQMPYLRRIEFVYCDFMTISFLNDLRKSIILEGNSLLDLDDASKDVSLHEYIERDKSNREVEFHGDEEDDDKSKSLCSARKFALREMCIRNSNLFSRNASVAERREESTGANVSNEENISSFNHQKKCFYNDFGIKLKLF